MHTPMFPPWRGCSPRPCARRPRRGGRGCGRCRRPPEGLVEGVDRRARHTERVGDAFALEDPTAARAAVIRGMDAPASAWRMRALSRRPESCDPCVTSAIRKSVSVIRKQCRGGSRSPSRDGRMRPNAPPPPAGGGRWITPGNGNRQRARHVPVQGTGGAADRAAACEEPGPSADPEARGQGQPRESRSDVGDNVPVRCPVCRRTHPYTPTHYPCACGAPVTPPLMRGAPCRADHPPDLERRVVTVRCGACGQQTQWPQPELGCPCGTVLRIRCGPSRGDGAAPRVPLRRARRAASAKAGTSPVRAPRRPPARRRAPAVHPVTIRTARDVVTAAAPYLRWLGFRDVTQPEERRPPCRRPPWNCVRAGLMAQVDPTTRPVALRAVERLWLEGLAAASTAVCFSSPATRRRRGPGGGRRPASLVMDLAGAPQPVNTPGRELVALGA